MAHKSFDKKTGLGERVNAELARELHKSEIKKIQRRKVYPRFKDTLGQKI